MVIKARSNIYHRVDGLKRDGNVTVRAVKEIKNGEYHQMRDDWEVYLQRPGLSGRRTIEAIRPHFNLWLNRRFGGLSFRMTQLLSGHGCFSSYLYRIGRSVTMACYHCDANMDSAEHTLMECPAWELERRELGNKIDGDVTLVNVVGSIVGSVEVWNAFRRFAKSVMSTKEEAERLRQRLEFEVNLPVDPARIDDELGSEE